MSILRCLNCNSELTKDMLDAEMCFNCGEKIDNLILTSELAKRLRLGSSTDGGAQYKIVNNYVYCAYCGKLLDDSVFESNICPHCKEYLVISEIDHLTKELVITQTEEIKFRQTEAKRIENERELRAIEEELQAAIELDERILHLEKFVTTGYNFEGYSITKYLSVISGQTVMGTGVWSEFSSSLQDFFGLEASVFSSKLDAAKENAFESLKLKAARLGANAIIGVDFDYITFSNNMIGVIANGTGVVIEKKE